MTHIDSQTMTHTARDKNRRQTWSDGVSQGFNPPHTHPPPHPPKACCYGERTAVGVYREVQCKGVEYRREHWIGRKVAKRYSVTWSTALWWPVMKHWHPPCYSLLHTGVCVCVCMFSPCLTIVLAVTAMAFGWINWLTGSTVILWLVLSVCRR